MRMIQYMETGAANVPQTEAPASRLQMSVYEHAYANHFCRRQWSLHHGLYVASAVVGSGTVARAPHPALPVPQLTQKLILESPRCRGWVTSADARSWVRNRLMHRGVTDVASAISDALHALQRAGVVALDERAGSATPPAPVSRRVRQRQSSAAAQPRSDSQGASQGDSQATVAEQAESRRRPGGRATVRFSKRSWGDITSNAVAVQLLSELGVAADHFQ